MPEADEIQRIQTEVRTLFENRGPRILGAQLGAILKSRFPTFDYRTRFPSLKQFLNSIFPGEISIVGKNGPDDIYTLAPTGIHSSESSGVVFAPGADLYELFRNPTLSGCLLYDSQSQTLLRGTEPPDPENSSCRIIERLTHSEQVAIMSEFAQMFTGREELAGIDEALKPEDPFYWQKFFLLVQRARLVPRWNSFRSKKITELIEDKLTKAEIPPEQIPDLLDQLLKTARFNRQPAAFPSGNKRLQAMKASSILQLAQDALAHLTEADLREIKIPLGAVWDSIQPRD